MFPPANYSVLQRKDLQDFVIFAPFAFEFVGMQSSAKPPSEVCVKPTIYGNPSSLISCHADRPALIELVVTLDDLGSGLRDLCRKSEKKILGDALLDGNASGGALIGPANEWIDLEAGRLQRKDLQDFVILLHSLSNSSECSRPPNRHQKFV